jgi:hypothetical protein
MTEIASAAKGVYKAAIELVCASVDLIAKMSGDSKAIADVTLFEIAKSAEMKPDGLAAKHLDHFLFGQGEPIEFRLATLLNEDVGVRKRLSDSIVQRLQGNPSLARKNMSGGDFVVPIRQRDFAIPDWRNALGSFPIEWEVVNISSDRRRTFALVQGANEYKWHPTADRVTQCIHKAGDRLTRSKEVKARNFWMIAIPCIIVVATGRPISI